MVDKAYLLNLEQIQDFIVNGYIQIHADFPADLHGDIYQQIEEVFAKEGNPGNNLLPRIPEIQRVFEHPKVCGALIGTLEAQNTLWDNLLTSRWCPITTAENPY